MRTITISRDNHEKFIFPVDKIAYVKFNDYERKITIAPTGAEAIFFNIPYYKRNRNDLFATIDEYDEIKTTILNALK
jgi:hypothetical protein